MIKSDVVRSDRLATAYEKLGFGSFFLCPKLGLICCVIINAIAIIFLYFEINSYAFSTDLFLHKILISLVCRHRSGSRV